MKSIYLDYNATTPIDPEVVEVMKPYLEEYFGNPSSSHWYGIQTKKAIEKRLSAHWRKDPSWHRSENELISKK